MFCKPARGFSRRVIRILPALTSARNGHWFNITVTV
jgi:hypothetical protein